MSDVTYSRERVLVIDREHTELPPSDLAALLARVHKAQDELIRQQLGVTEDMLKGHHEPSGVLIQARMVEEERARSLAFGRRLLRTDVA